MIVLASGEFSLCVGAAFLPRPHSRCVMLQNGDKRRVGGMHAQSNSPQGEWTSAMASFMAWIFRKMLPMVFLPNVTINVST
jgi:hypothetical protein